MILSHLSTENPEGCSECNASNSLIKVLTTFNTAGKTVTEPKKVGDVTEEFIESSRADLRRQREELVKKR